jgi:starvation-inducible outer membrane lipoprotein
VAGLKLSHCALLATTLLLLAGCNAVPMTYQEWREEQERRRTAESTGIPFKSKRQLLAEGEELKRIVGEVQFP